ncbi:radical SAM protein [Kluyvera sichuanensis]|uniref:radical SAM protein n=1 Tax=Kluyvera sichuanensis TaxID=2725494 RepID=UPI0039F52E0D
MTGRQVEAASPLAPDDAFRCMVNRQNCLQPQRWYREFRQTGMKSVQLIPLIDRDESGNLSARSVQPEEWGAFLRAVFDLWVREDINIVQIRLFESTLAIWRGFSPHIACNADVVNSACSECPVLRFCHDGCPDHRCTDGKNALCEGYRHFYTYSAPYMKAMRDLLKQHRSPMELMAMLSQAE